MCFHPLKVNPSEQFTSKSDVCNTHLIEVFQKITYQRYSKMLKVLNIFSSDSPQCKVKSQSEECRLHPMGFVEIEDEVFK